MNFFNVLSVDEVKELIKKNFTNMKIESEKVNIIDSLGKVLSSDIISEFNVPDFNRSTVDGYAIKNSDSHGCSESMPSFLNLLGEVEMGCIAKESISYGNAIYVPTGGMIPEGADAVIMIEYVEKLDEDTIAIHKPVSIGENIVYKGDDIKNGQVVLTKGKEVTYQDIGVLAALGIKEVDVYKDIRFYIISTGDEIVDIDEELKFGKIRDINGYALHGLISKLGGKVINKTIVKDNYDYLREEVKNGIESSDIVLISGGSSVGARDFTHDVINSFDGQGILVHGVALKPGKPTILGECCNKPVFGLPGHPVSALIVFKIFVEYLVNELLNIKDNNYSINAVMDSNLHSSPGKQTYQMVNIEERDEKYYAIPNFGKSSMITLLSKSCGYVILDGDNEGLYKGQEVRVHLF